MKLTTNKKFNQPKPLKKIVKKPNNQKFSEIIENESENENDTLTENSKGEEEIKVELKNSEILGKNGRIYNINILKVSEHLKSAKSQIMKKDYINLAKLSVSHQAKL